MGIRRNARELAMQALFDMDMGKDHSLERFRRFCLNFAPNEQVTPFFEKLVQGVLDNRADIDDLIKKNSANWKISRMNGVDRNVMRIAIYELLYCEDIPAKVSINEAIDIGKKYGTEESGAFINGILDSIRMDKDKIDSTKNPQHKE